MTTPTTADKLRAIKAHHGWNDSQLGAEMARAGRTIEGWIQERWSVPEAAQKRIEQLYQQTQGANMLNHVTKLSPKERGGVRGLHLPLFGLKYAVVWFVPNGRKGGGVPRTFPENYSMIKGGYDTYEEALETARAVRATCEKHKLPWWEAKEKGWSLRPSGCIMIYKPPPGKEYIADPTEWYCTRIVDPFS